jgi:predicted acylesterase/phospholipase RssA
MEATIRFVERLVLADGGAKGAYQFGCLEVFRDYAVKFDAVSGTSVGALNGVTWATNQFELGRKLWRDLSFENVYPVRFPKWLPLWLRWGVAGFYLVAQFLWTTLNHIPVPIAAGV